MSDFEQINALESALVETQSGRRSFAEFLKLLMQSEVYVSSGSEIQPDGTGFQPLLFEKNQETLIAVFTARDRAARYAATAPYCLSMSGRQLIERVSPECGIVLNPGYSFGFELPAEGIQRIRRDFAKIE